MVNVSVPNLSSALQGLLHQDASLAAISGARAPMIFSSLMRKVQSGLTTLDFPQARQVQGAPAGTQEAAVLEAAQNQAIKTFIEMAVNPKSVKFSQPKRYARVDGVGGTVWHHFENDDGQDNDILTISFSGNTGNLDRRGSLSAPDRLPGSLVTGTAIDAQALAQQDTGALDRLLIFHNLYLLTREPRLFHTTDGRAVRNRFYITYMSAVFPLQIDFTGFFTKVLDWEDSGQKPYSRDYTMEFIAEESDPPLDDFITQLATRITQVKANPAAAAKFLTDNLPSKVF